MTQGLRIAGRSGWIFAGFAFGIGKVISTLLSSQPDRHARLESLGIRIDEIGRSVARLEARTESLEYSRESAISRTQLNAAIEEAFVPLVRDIDRRFGQNAESVEALRLMVGRTDELLGRVLEHLESMHHETAA